MIDDRLAAIVDQLDHRKRITVAEFSALLGASSATVRRDLNRLVKAGIVRRVHGGAILVRDAIVERSSETQRTLARGVRAQIHPGDVIVLEGERVMPLVAEVLAEAPVRSVVITNNLSVARTLQGRTGIELMLIGGKLFPNGVTLPAAMGAGDLKYLVANKAFVEVDGMHGTAGASARIPEEAAFKHAILQHALHTAIVGPFDVWSSTFAHRIAQPNEIETWITTSIPSARRDEVHMLPCAIVESV
jgi:DeoR family transcriptional regulator, fructose operon transcriptional repressor